MGVIWEKIKQPYRTYALRRQRTQWLNQATDLLIWELRKHGYLVWPPRSVTCCAIKFRSADARLKTNGLYTHKEKILISSGMDDVFQVLDTLLHEVVHHMAGIRHEHDRLFTECLQSAKVSCGSFCLLRGALPPYPQEKEWPNTITLAQ